MLSLSCRQLHFHIMVEFERGLRRLSGPAPSAPAESLRSSCPGLCSDSFLISPRMKNQKPLWGTITGNKHLLMFRRQPVSFILCPLSLILSLRPTKKSLTYLFAPSYVVLNIVKVTLQPPSCRDCSSPSAGLCTYSS